MWLVLGCAASVEINDLAFGYHAVLLTAVTIVQCALYKTQRQRVHPIHAFIVASLWLLTAYTLVLCFLSSVPLLPKCTSTPQPDGTIRTTADAAFTLIDFMGYVKAFISIIKYTPQAYLNYRRQSTVGWSIVNILLDFTGGTLSFGQQVVDSINAGSTYPLFGNIPKLLLALESVAFDILFMVQHYVLYRGRGVKEGEEPLMDGEGEDGGAETDKVEGAERGERDGEGEGEGEVEGQVEGAERRGRPAPKKPQSLGSRKLNGGGGGAAANGAGRGRAFGQKEGKQRRPLRLLGDAAGDGVDADGVPSSSDFHYHPPEVVDEDADDDPYQPGFSSPAGRINHGAGLTSFSRAGVEGEGSGLPSRGSRLGGGSPRLAIVDRYGEGSGVPGGRR